MGDTNVSRRHFVGGSAAAMASVMRLGAPTIAAIAQAACTARDEGAAYATLSATEAVVLEAIAARILPTTDTPGAREAGVIYFMDNVLGDQLGYLLPGIRGMLQEFVGDVSEQHDGAAFPELSESEQDAVLRERERSPFFFLTRALTLMGFFSMTSYGGNKDYVGWDLIGFDGHVATQPPFGYYDAEYMEAESDGR